MLHKLHNSDCITSYIQDENPQVDHARAIKEYDRSAADKVWLHFKIVVFLCFSTFLSHWNCPLRREKSTFWPSPSLPSPEAKKVHLIELRCVANVKNRPYARAARGASTSCTIVFHTHPICDVKEP